MSAVKLTIHPKGLEATRVMLEPWADYVDLEPGQVAELELDGHERSIDIAVGPGLIQVELSPSPRKDILVRDHPFRSTKKT